MHQLCSYLKFLFRSKNQHGVHSPFVYDLVTTCFYNQTHYGAYDALNAYRRRLQNTSVFIDISDLGAGSRRLSSKRRTVSQMVRTSSSSRKTAALLFRLARYFKSQTALELGTSLGLATYAIALGQQNGYITSIEGCPNTSDYAKQQLEIEGISNIKFLKGDFTAMIPRLTSKSFNLVFFDGHHQKAATLNYFEALLPKAHNDSVFIFDDIYWSKGMTEAWEIIKAHPKVSVTIDTFQLGLVFFRKEQPKEHFKIRV